MNQPLSTSSCTSKFKYVASNRYDNYSLQVVPIYPTKPNAYHVLLLFVASYSHYYLSNWV